MKRMRALGRRGPGIVPKRFRPLLLDERDEYTLWPSFRTWVERASAGDLVAAYKVCRNVSARYYMVYRVGRRGLHGVQPLLVQLLNDPEQGMRAGAADALARIGDPGTGRDLFWRYAVEDDPVVRAELVFALGCTGYRPALQVLIDALADPDDWYLRDNAAKGLGWLGATEALPALQRAVARETDDWVRRSIRWAIDKLQLEGG